MVTPKQKDLLRWIALPFASLIGALLGSMILGLLSWWGAKFAGGYSEDGWYYRYLMPIFSSGVFGYLFSVISLNVAPKSKIIATTVLITLLGVISLFSIGLAWQMHYSHGLGYFVEILIGCVVGMIAAIAAVIEHKDKI